VGDPVSADQVDAGITGIGFCRGDSEEGRQTLARALA
jgi:hypothetical protein